MPVSLQLLEDLREEYFADDLELTDAMLAWDEDTARAFFEAGGVLTAAAAKPKASHETIPTSQPISAPSSPGGVQQNFKRVKFFGDSHVNTFISIESSLQPILAFPYTAGSAMGLRHADSITGYREALEGDLYGTKSTDLIVLKFGQVDADFVYYLKLADQPSLTFDAFAVDSVRKYFSFVDDALACLPVTREQLCIATPFPTCVPDSHLRESLCTLPFMDQKFKTLFRTKLESMALPSLQTRTEYGAKYAALLRTEAEARGLRCIDLHMAMLGPRGVNGLINADQNHHLVDAHIPLLLPALDGAFGGTHAHCKLPSPSPPAAGTSSSHSNKEAEGQAAMMWLQLFTALRSGQVPLKLGGHAVGSYRDVQRRFGPPLPLQLSQPQKDAPGFATWLVKFAAPPTPPSPPTGAAAVPPQQPEINMVRILGRFRNYDDEHAWLVECSSPALVDSVRSVMEAPASASSGGGASSRRRLPPAFEVPPLAFHQALSGRR